MGRPRNQERDLSLERYLESDGKITNAELAKLAGVPENRIRKWKSEDKWKEALKKKKRPRGGQKGNKNATGKTPAKKDNRNAVTHGAFAKTNLDNVPPEKLEAIRGMMQSGALVQMMDELQNLYLRKVYLESLLEEYERPDDGRFYADKIVHMIVPKSIDDTQKENDTGFEIGLAKDPEAIEGEQSEQFKTAMKSVIKASPFDRAMKVEAELNKLHGRIIKQLDSIKAYEMEDRRLQLEERRLELAKQKLTGEINIDPVSEDITGDDMAVDI